MESNKPTHQSDDATPLPEWFSPCDKDVICGWARQNHHHPGNKRFRDLIDDFAPQYVKASTKLEKTQVIANVIERVRADSPNGGFIKKDFYSGRWYEIGNEKARDKVGHAIRKSAEELMKKKGMEGKSSKKSLAKAAIAEKRERNNADVNAERPDVPVNPLLSPTSRESGIINGLRQSSLVPSSFLLDRTSLSRNPGIFGAGIPASLIGGHTPLTQASLIADSQVMPNLAGAGLPLSFGLSPEAQYLSSLRAQATALGGAFGGSLMPTNSIRAASIASAALEQELVMRGRLAALRELELAQALSTTLRNQMVDPTKNTDDPALSNNGNQSDLETLLSLQKKGSPVHEALLLKARGGGGSRTKRLRHRHQIVSPKLRRRKKRLS